MIRFCLVMIASFSLAACTSTDGVPNFANMNEQELAEYNSSRPLDQMIVCNDENRSFSRVRRRSCGTVEEKYGSANQAEQLSILNTAPLGGN